MEPLVLKEISEPAVPSPSLGNQGKSLSTASDCLHKPGSCLLAVWFPDTSAQWLCSGVPRTPQSCTQIGFVCLFVCFFACVIFKHHSEDEMKAVYFISPSRAGQNK